MTRMQNAYRLKYSVCIEMMFPEYGFYDRVAASVACGLPDIEIWHWADHDMPRLESELEKHGARIIMTNPSSPDDAEVNAQLWRGILSVKDDGAILDAVEATLPVCRRLCCTRLVMLPGDTDPGASRPSQYDRLQRLLARAAELMGREGITLIFEPLCLMSRPVSFVSRAQEGFRMIREIGSPHIRLLYDLYHQQLMEGNLIATIRENLPLIGHIHVSDAPDRLPPGNGEINVRNVLRAAADAGYDGYAGMEYIPRATTADTLNFMV